MFTGIVEEIGTVVAVTPGAEGADQRLTVRGPTVTDGARHGDSIAVDGVCLTVAALDGETFTADVMPESMDRTALGGLTVGAAVNLERAVRADGRLDGHIVQGHVDGVGTIRSRRPGPRWDDVVIQVPPELARYIAEKGSITVQGVSLTVTHAGSLAFGISLIPTTLAGTTLGELIEGSEVNLEVDVLAKYVERLLEAGGTLTGPGPAAPGAGPDDHPAPRDEEPTR